MNFFDRNPAGQHVSQFAPCPYIAPIPIQEPSVITHTGSLLLKSTGFNIGDRIAIALMLWKDLSRYGVHWKVWLFCAEPDNSVVYAVISGMYSVRYCQGNPWALWRLHNHTGWQRGKPEYE